jgi:hypothetical protein
MSPPHFVAKHKQLVNNTHEWNASLPFIVSLPLLLSNEFPFDFKEEDLFELVLSAGPLASLKKYYFCPKK